MLASVAAERTRLVMAVMAVALMASCERAPGGTITTARPVQPTPQSNPVAPPPAAGCPSTSPVGSPAVLATLARTPCLGTCPVYQVTVLTDGTVEYHGDHFVTVTGDQTGHLSTADLAKLIAAYQAIDYLHLKEQPVTMASTDAPSVITSFACAGESRKIDDYLGEDRWPPAVRALEKQIDTIVGTSRWVGGGAVP
jgi:hypothetical protein